jgi:hypothetical protein
MNISKVKLVWKFLTGGREGVLDYVIDVANSLMAQLAASGGGENAKTYLGYAQKVLGTMQGLEWLCPQKWRTAYGLTVTAVADVAAALADLNVTSEEISGCYAAFQCAYSAWRAE